MTVTPTPKRFVPKGPKRYAHQTRGLKKIISTKGVAALLFDPGCIAGDALVKVNRAGITRTMTLRDLEFKFNGGVTHHKSWDPSIPTMIQREQDGVVRLARVVRVAQSGEKQLWKLTTFDGRTIRATEDHPFLVPVTGASGSTTELRDLERGDKVLVNGGRSKGGRTIKQRYVERAGLRHHPLAFKRDAKHSPYRVAEHRLVVEADMNKLSLSDYTNRLRAGELTGLVFLRADEHVHHIDLNPKHNDRSNLRVMTESDHHRLHAELGKNRHVLEQITTATVEWVSKDSVEMTYDVTVADDPHNFIVNGFVVENTGKTMTALDFCSLLALKALPNEVGVREVRVLVTAPLAAVDTWVDQAERYVSDDVQLWAEAFGDRTSIRQRAEALAARGGRPFKKESKTRKRHGPRGIHYDKSVMLRYRSDRESVLAQNGPDALGTARPRLIIEVVNLDTFSSRMKVGGTSTVTLADVVFESVKRFAPDLVIVDESHKIKSPTSNVSRMLARIGKLTKRRMILTGTVMPIGPMDVYGQWRFVNPYAFGELMPDGERRIATFSNFRNRYAELGGWGGTSVISYKNLDELQKIMALNAEVVKKKDALDLPDALPAILRVDLNAHERKAYDEMKKGLATQLSTGLHASSANQLSQMMRLRQITSGHLPDDLGNVNVLGDSKVKVIKSLVQDTLAGEDRVVVFCVFLFEIEMLRAALKEVGTELMVISGQTKSDDRLAMRQKFGNTKDNPGRIVMIAQVRTMSLAVNELVTACNAVFGSLPTDRSDFIQAQDRLDRIGQTRPVTFWFALVPKSIDEIIYNAHATRTNLEAAVLRHIFEGDVPQELSAAQADRRDENEQETQVGRLMVSDESGTLVYSGTNEEAKDRDFV